MTDAAPEILYSIDRAGDPIALIERRDEMDQAEVLDKYPDLTGGKHTTELARLVNHFAREFKYEVIDDPEAFAKAYRAQIAAEDADAEWEQGNPKLRDFGMPDLEEIAAPKLSAGTLTFYARSKRLGVPYVVNVEIDGKSVGKADYQPMKMSPITD